MIMQREIGKRKHGPKRAARRTRDYRLRDTHKHDAAAQTAGGEAELDPTEWTGNQRVLHFGPLAQRDPFFYYYPKGWDILYPATFGFFPYRTKKFRGSVAKTCLASFGFFLLFGGAAMTYVGYVLQPPPFWERIEAHRAAAAAGNLTRSPAGTLPPLQAVGPSLALLGAGLLAAGALWWLAGLRLCSERLRHTQPHAAPPKRTVRRVHQPPVPFHNFAPDGGAQEPQVKRALCSPLTPAPPTYAVLANTFTEPAMFSVDAELKLYPPVGPGHSSLSLQRAASCYSGGYYNTLGQRDVSVPASWRRSRSKAASSVPPEQRHRSGGGGPTSIRIGGRRGSQASSVVSAADSNERGHQRRHSPAPPAVDFVFDEPTGRRRQRESERRRSYQPLTVIEPPPLGRRPAQRDVNKRAGGARASAPPRSDDNESDDDVVGDLPVHTRRPGVGRVRSATPVAGNGRLL